MIKREFEVYSYEEAVNAAEAEGLTVYRNKTASWKSAGSPVSDKDLKKFAEDKLKEDKRTAAGEGSLLLLLPVLRTPVNVLILMRMLLLKVVWLLSVPMRFAELTMVSL